ncbi:MAG TPA: hypothetical protein VFL36_12775 [Myxococcales bacterium]|nr:hypothetical protein [Myxococcales bacterium]
MNEIIHDIKPFPRMRWAAAAWLVVWVPAYASVWGFANFLHLCDVAVIVTCAGIWSGSALLLSSQALFSIFADLLWDVDVCSRLISGRHLFGGTEYLWQPGFPLFVRLLSLFHVVQPLVLLWCLRRVGYDRRGLPLQAAITLCALVASRAFGPALNLNYAFRDPLWNRQVGPAPLHLALISGAMILFLYLPAHLLLTRLFMRRERPPS